MLEMKKYANEEKNNSNAANLIGKKASIDVLIKQIFDSNAHIEVGGKVLSVPLTKLKILNN